MPEDLLRAENVFNQLSFMYKQAVLRREKHNETGNFGSNKSVAPLEFKLQNAERETNYYQN